MTMHLKEKINEQLSKMASGIQVSSSSYLCWGEVELPECLRQECESSEAQESR